MALLPSLQACLPSNDQHTVVKLLLRRMSSPLDDNSFAHCYRMKMNLRTTSITLLVRPVMADPFNSTGNQRRRRQSLIHVEEDDENVSVRTREHTARCLGPSLYYFSIQAHERNRMNNSQLQNFCGVVVMQKLLRVNCGI
jgi:hypothetical protein